MALIGWAKRLIIGLCGVGLVGCTSYQVPSYYQQAQQVNQVGQVYWVKDLRCSQRPELCGDQPQAWVKHRAYEKNYYFE